jgi:hypothetical protein
VRLFSGTFVGPGAIGSDATVLKCATAIGMTAYVRVSVRVDFENP